MAVTIPIGTLTKKIQCQSSSSVRTPPASRPIDAPAAATKLYRLIARVRSAGSVNIVTIIPRMTAEVIAPPRPWMNRDAMRTGPLGLIPQTSEASVKTVRPTRKMRRRPSRSPRRPASSRTPPKAMR